MQRCAGRRCVGRRIAGGHRARNDFAAVLQFVLTVGDDDVPLLQAGGKAGSVTSGLRDRNGANADDISLTHEINVGALRAALNSGYRNEREIFARVYEQMDVDELVREERVVLIIEDGFEFVRSGGGIDLIVDGEKLAGSNFERIIPIEGIHVELNAFAEFVVNLRELILRQAKDDGDGLNLRDDKEAVGVRSVNNVAGIDEAQAYATGDGRSDAAIVELKFGVVDLRLVGFYRAVELADLRLLRIELLLGDDAFFEKKLEAFVIRFGVAALRFIFRELTFRLLELNLKWPWIDFGEEVALLNELPSLKATLISWPSTRLRTVTVLSGVTLPRPLK